MLNQLGKHQMEECFTFAEVRSTRCKVKIYQMLVSSTCTCTLQCRFMTTEEGTGVNPGGGGGGGGEGGWEMYPPPPPLFEDKIHVTLNSTFIVKKLTFLTVKLLKTQKIARSHTNVF